MANEGKGLPRQYRNLVRVIGTDAMLRLCREYGGEVIYIPKLDKLLSAKRGEVIRAEWNGSNTVELARKYGVTIRTVQKEVEGIPKPQIPGQISLEDLLNDNGS